MASLLFFFKYENKDIFVHTMFFCGYILRHLCVNEVYHGSLFFLPCQEICVHVKYLLGNH